MIRGAEISDLNVPRSETKLHSSCGGIGLVFHFCSLKGLALSVGGPAGLYN